MNKSNASFEVTDIHFSVIVRYFYVYPPYLLEKNTVNEKYYKTKAGVQPRYTFLCFRIL